jgi:hypothetical protein
MTSRHQPSRPTWRCDGCGHDWPCPPRREELLAETAGGPVALALLMAEYFHDAVGDHPTVLVSALYVRFFDWVPHGPGGSASLEPGRCTGRVAGPGG